MTTEQQDMQDEQLDEQSEQEQELELRARVRMQAILELVATHHDLGVLTSLALIEIGAMAADVMAAVTARISASINTERPNWTPTQRKDAAVQVLIEMALTESTTEEAVAELAELFATLDLANQPAVRAD
jgi:hypothetical protein